MTDCCATPEPTWYGAMPTREALNEEAWQCLGCGAQLGFRPDLDREHTYMKVRCILTDFHESKLIYVSNGTIGGIVACTVAARCQETNRYDQQSILEFILSEPNMSATHATFWQNRATRYLMGGEPIRDEQEALPFAHSERSIR